MTAMLKKTLIGLFNPSSLAYLFILMASSAVNAVPIDLSLTGNLSSSTVSVGNSSTLTYTLTNNSSSDSASDIGFTVNLPLGVVVAEQTNDSISCDIGSYTLVAGGNNVVASGYQLSQGQSCKLIFNVTASSAGVLNITTTDLSSSIGGGTDSSTTLTASDTSVSTTLSLSPSSISVGNFTRLTLALANTQNSYTYGFSGKIDLPSGLVIAPVINFSTDCGDYMLLTESAGASSITLTSQSYPLEQFAFLTPGSDISPSTCNVSIDLLSSVASDYDIITSDMTYTNTSNRIGKASTFLDVQKQFVSIVLDPLAVTPGQTANLNVSLTNFDRNNNANNITFSDNLESALTGLIATGLPIDDVCGSGSVLSGTDVVTLINGSLSGGASCSFSIPVQIPANSVIGLYNNVVSNISSSINNYADVANAFYVSNAPTLSIDVLESGITAGDTITLRYTLTNIDNAFDATGLAFSTLIGGTSVATISTLPGSNFCNSTGASSSQFLNDAYQVNLSAITLAAGQSCTFDVGLTLNANINSGTYPFIAQQIKATIDGQTISSQSPSANAVISVNSAPSLRFSFQDNVLLPGAASVIDFELSHHANASADATNIAFTLDLDAGLAGLVATGLPISDVCGAGTVVNGSSTISFSGGSLNPGGTCNFSVPIQLPAGTVGSNFTFTSSNTTASVAGNEVNKAGGASSVTVTGLRFSQSFSDSAIKVGNAGSQVDVIYLLTNETGAGDATSITFNENFSSFISGTTIASANQSGFCGAGSTTSGAGVSFLVVSGVEVANGLQCVITVTLNIPNTVVANNYLSATSNLSATIGGANTSLSPAVANLNVNELTVVTSVDVSSPTSESLITLSINFSDNVTGFDETDIIATNALLSNFAGADANYTVDVTPSANGYVTLQIGANAAFDILDGSVGNKAALDTTFEYQTTPIVATPSLTLSNPSNVLVSSGPVTYTVSYTDVEQVDLNTNEVTLNTTGTANADITVLNGDTSGVTVSLDNIVGNGSIGISIVAGTARFSTNLAPSAGPSAVFVVDTIKPSVVLSTASLNQTADFTVNMVFDESVSGFNIDDISVVNGSLSNFQTIDAKTYSVLVSATGETTIGLSVVDSAASDSAGNGNNASNSLNVIYDDLLPSVSLSGPSGTVTVGFTATIDFSEIVTGFDVNDIQVTNANLSSFTNVDGKKYTVLVSPIAQSTVSLAVDAAVAVDTFNNSNTASNSYSVIYDFNDAPVISGSPASSVNEDSGYSFIPSASDDDSGDSLSFSITNKPTWASFNSGNGQLSGTPTNADVGTTAGIVISVNDGNVTIALTAFSITVVNTNDAPVISGNPAKSVNEDSGYSFTPSASDDDSGDSLSFSITNKPTWASFNGTNGQLSGTPTNADVGITAGIVISVSDGSVTTALTAFSISVVNTNDAPVISGNPATSVNEDSGYSFTPSASDDDIGDSLSFSITNKPTWASFNSGNGQLSGTPTNANVGTTSGIVISVSDSSVTTALTAFSISVVNTNDAPVITGSPATSVNEDSVYSFAPSASDDDSGDSLSFNITNKPTWASFNSGNGQLSGTPTNVNVGTTSGIVISVSDGSVTTSLTAFSITVINTNDAPVISGNPASSVNEDSAYSFTPSVSDDDIGDSLSFSITNKPTWASFNSGNGQLSGTPTNANVGTTSGIVISVSDSSVTTALTAFSISVVNTNDAPVITGSPATSVNEDSVYSFAPSANDDDSGDSLSFSITNKPTWASFNSVNGLLSGTPTNADVGTTAGIVISVSDGSVTTALTAFSIAVINTNDAPVISGNPATSVNEDSAYSFTPNVSDDDSGDSLSFTITNKPTWASFNAATGLLSGTPTNADVGTTSGIVISVNDGTVTKALTAFSIIVANTNDVPVISSIAILTAMQDQVYQYTFVVTDDDSGDVLTFNAVVKPDWLNFNTATAVLSGTPTNADVGSHIVSLKVTDSAGLSAEQSFSISVNNINDAPVITSIAVISATQDQIYNYTLVASDADIGDSLSLNALVKPSWLSFDTVTGVLSGTPTNADVGSHVVSLKVTDSAGLSAEQNFSISVNNVNDAPVISSTAIITATQDLVYNYILVANDADIGDSLSFNASVIPDWLSFDTATGILSGTPKNTDVGSHSVTLIVTDNAGLNAEQSFSIDVSNVNDAPEIMGSPLLSINEDESYIFKPDVTDADEDDSLSFIIVNKPTWAKFNGTDGTLSGIPSNDDVGVTFGIIISVSDGTIEIELPAFDIEVINVNDAPVFESEPIIEASVFAPYQYDVVVSDDDVDSSLTVAVVMAPEWLSLNSSNQLVGIPPAESADMTFEVEVSVTDAIVELPVIQRFSLAVSQPTDTELGVNIYFSPAPAIVGQKVNLVVDIVNNGYTAALGLNYQVTFGSEFSTVVLPNECSELSAGIIDCVVADELAIGDSLSQIIELMVDNVDSGFSSANISVTATNVNSDIFERETSILLANTLSILPGKVLTSVPASLGYAVDMNADNFTDLLVYIPDDLTIQIMINDGLGQLMPGVKIVLNQAVTSFTATDINVDGNIDIITTGGDIAGNRAYMLDGLFAVNSVENLDDVKADVMLISDFDFDGYSEVVLAGTYQPQVAIYSGVGSGSSTVNLVPIPFSLPSFSAAKGLQQVSAVTGVVTSSESKITALSAIATDGVIKLLVGVENQAPVLLTLDDNDWVSSAVVSLTQGAQRLINTDLDNDGKADLFVKDDNGWHLIMDAFSNDFIKSSVMFPNADDIVVTDLEADGIPELLLVMSHGVSIWHYYGPDDIRPGNYVIDAEALGTVTVLDINNDDLLDIITFDKQDGVSVWYMSAGGGVGLQDVDLALSSLMPSYPEVDRAVNITWSVFNLSDASASDVTLSVMFDTDIVLPQIPSGCALVGTILTCQLGEIASGKSKDVTFSLRPERDGKLSLIGNVTSLEYDVNNVNNQRDASFDFASAEKSDGGSLPLWTVLLIFMFASIRANIHRYR